MFGGELHDCIRATSHHPAVSISACWWSLSMLESHSDAHNKPSRLRASQRAYLFISHGERCASTGLDSQRSTDYL